MAHLTTKDPYGSLVDRINRGPHAAIPMKNIHGILQLLLGEDEADLLSRVPVRPFPAEEAARLWGRPVAQVAPLLRDLAARGILLDLEKDDGRVVYLLTPPVIGFFEFVMMKVRKELDQKELSRLLEDLFFRDDRFLENMLRSLETRMGRVFANESLLADTASLEVLDYDRVSTMVKEATHISLAMCFCRHKAHHLGRSCTAPADNCISLNQLSRSLSGHGTTRRITVRECMEVIERAQEANLVQIGENVQNQPAYICNCCSCCCEFLHGVRRFGSPITVNTSNYLPEVQGERCNGCGLCVAACPVEAAGLQVPVEGSGKGTCRINDQLCLGCGICVKACRRGALVLRARGRRVLTPVNIAHRVVLNALENGTLSHLLLNTQASRGHRALAALLDAILALGPVHRLLASEQVRSTYLNRLLRDVRLV